MQNRSVQAAYKEREGMKLPVIRPSTASILEHALFEFESLSKKSSCTRVGALLSKSGFSTPYTGYSLSIFQANSTSGCFEHYGRDAAYLETYPASSREFMI